MPLRKGMLDSQRVRAEEKGGRKKGARRAEQAVVGSEVADVRRRSLP